MNSIENNTNTIITNLSLPDLNLIHSSLSHQVIDISRNMRHQSMTCEAHNMLSAQMTEVQKVIHKIGVVIESRKSLINQIVEFKYQEN